jgi:hypothetical protein
MPPWPAVSTDPGQLTAYELQLRKRQTHKDLHIGTFYELARRLDNGWPAARLRVVRQERRIRQGSEKVGDDVT